MKFDPVRVAVAVMAVPTRPLRVWLAGLIEGAESTVMLTVAVVATYVLSAALVAVTTHVPAPVPVKVKPLKVQGPPTP